MASEQDNGNETNYQTDASPPLSPKPPSESEGDGKGGVDWKAKLKNAAVAAKDTGKAAALAVAKNSERTKIQNVDLPKAYAALGRDIHSRGSYRQELADIYGQLDTQFAKLEEIERRGKERPKGATVTEKAKAAGAAAKDTAEVQAHRVQISRLMTTLGKKAFEQYGEQSGPRQLASSISRLTERASVLEAEIKGLSKSSLTPKRLLIGGALVVVVFALLISAIESTRKTGREAASTTEQVESEGFDSRSDEVPAGSAIGEQAAEEPSSSSEGSDGEAGNTTVQAQDIVLTEEFWPLVPGARKLEHATIYVPNGKQFVFKRLVLYETEGSIRRHCIEARIVDGDRIVETPNRPGDDIKQYRVEGGFVEIGVPNTPLSGMTWSRVLKIGATVGDRWNDSVYEYELTGFEQYDDKPVAVIEQTGRQVDQTVTTWVRHGFGPMLKKCWTNGVLMNKIMWNRTNLEENQN